MEYQIITDGSCDLGKEMEQKTGIKVVPFYVSFDDQNYKKEIEEIDVREFYQQMVDNPKIYPKSSLPSVEDYIEAFEPYLKKEMAIICICITTKFSGSFNSANNAKQILQETHPNAKIEVIDATVNTVLQGALVLEVVRMKNNGLSFEETITNIEEIKKTGRIIFTIKTMDYLVNGGRVGKLLGVAASTLGLKPLIILKEGEIFPAGITRSRKKARLKLIELAINHFQKIHDTPDNYQLVVGYGYDYKEAVEFRDQLMESLKLHFSINEIPIFQIGATIGVHTGPHPLGMGLIKKYDCLYTNKS